MKKLMTLLLVELSDDDLKNVVGGDGSDTGGSASGGASGASDGAGHQGDDHSGHADCDPRVPPGCPA